MGMGMLYKSVKCECSRKAHDLWVARPAANPGPEYDAVSPQLEYDCPEKGKVKTSDFRSGERVGEKPNGAVEARVVVSGE